MLASARPTSLLHSSQSYLFRLNCHYSLFHSFCLSAFASICERLQFRQLQHLSILFNLLFHDTFMSSATFSIFSKVSCFIVYLFSFKIFFQFGSLPFIFLCVSHLYDIQLRTNLNFLLLSIFYFCSVKLTWSVFCLIRPFYLIDIFGLIPLHIIFLPSLPIWKYFLHNSLGIYPSSS